MKLNSKVKGWQGKLIVTLTSVIVSLVIFEILIQLAFPISGLYSYSEHTDYLLQKNVNISFKWNEFNTIIKTNSFGIRDDEINYNETDNILLLGDSFTFGHGVEHEETFGFLLEEKLNEQRLEKKQKQDESRQSKRKIEVINTGHNGYDTRREYEFLTNYGDKFNPNIVVVNFLLNDPNSNSGEFWFSPISLGKLSDYFPFRSIDFMIGYLKKPEIIFELLELKKSEKRTKHFNCFTIASCKDGWAASFKYLDKIDSYAKENGIMFILVNVPFKEQIGNKESIVAEILQKYATLRNIHFIDLEKSQLNKDDYYKNDGHWNKKGHEKAAQFIFNDMIKEQNLIFSEDKH